MCKLDVWVLIIIVLVLTCTFIHENFGGCDMARLKVNRKGNNTTMDTIIDGNETKMMIMMIRTHQWQQQQQQTTTQQQQQQKPEHQADDGLLQLVLLPVSTDPETFSIDILANLPRNGFLVRTTQEFSLVLPDFSSSQSRPLQLPSFSVLPTTTDNWNAITRRIRGQNDYSHYRQLERTSSQAKRHNCIIAANAGPFNKDGSCVGTVVVNGQIIQHDQCGMHNNNNSNSSSSSVGFGITAGPVRNWVLGSLRASDNDDIHKLGIVHFVTGFDWLVQNGVNVANATGRNNTTGAERAPRTSIGIDNQGRLVILVTDGCELWYVMRA